NGLRAAQATARHPARSPSTARRQANAPAPGMRPVSPPGLRRRGSGGSMSSPSNRRASARCSAPSASAPRTTPASSHGPSAVTDSTAPRARPTTTGTKPSRASGSDTTAYSAAAGPRRPKVAAARDRAVQGRLMTANLEAAGPRSASRQQGARRAELEGGQGPAQPGHDQQRQQGPQHRVEGPGAGEGGAAPRGGGVGAGAQRPGQVHRDEGPAVEGERGAE